MKEYKISKEFMDMRLDRYIYKLIPKFSKSTVQKLLRKKIIKVNKKKAEGSYRLNKGDIISFYLSDEHFPTKIKYINNDNDIDFPKLNILYESEMMLILNKPAGILSQPDGSNKENLVNMISAYLSANNNYNTTYGVTNRLDRNTSGLIVAGKTRRALMLLGELNKQYDQISKSYITLVKGRFKAENQLYTHYAKKDNTNNIMRIYDNPNPKFHKIQTIFNTISTHNNYSLITAKLITGRFHQIRATLNHMGYPIIGDRKYNDNNHFDLENQAHLQHHLLHAYKLTFKMNKTIKELMPDKYNVDIKNIVFQIPLPTELTNILKEVSIKPPVL